MGKAWLGLNLLRFILFACSWSYWSYIGWLFSHARLAWACYILLNFFFFLLMILKPSQQLFQRLRLTLDRLTALHVLKLSLLHCATFTRHLRGCLKSALTKTKAERFLRTAGGYPRCLLQGCLLLLHWRSYICKVGSLVPHAPLLCRWFFELP